MSYCTAHCAFDPKRTPLVAAHMSAFGGKATPPRGTVCIENCWKWFPFSVDRIPCSRADVLCSAKIIPCFTGREFASGSPAGMPLFGVSSLGEGAICKIFLVLFPVSREFANRDRFEIECVHHHSVASSPNIWRLATQGHGWGPFLSSFSSYLVSAASGGVTAGWSPHPKISFLVAETHRRRRYQRIAF